MSNQKWNGYPDSPVTTEEYPHQIIVYSTEWNTTYLCASNHPMYFTAPGTIYGSVEAGAKTTAYSLSNGNWVLWQATVTAIGIPTQVYKEANNPLYTNNTLNVILFNKTTGKKPIASIALNPLNNKQYIITLASPAGEYQKWSGYPDSPVKTADYPYQAIFESTYSGNLYTILVYSATPLYMVGSDQVFNGGTPQIYYTQWNGGATWDTSYGSGSPLNIQSNGKHITQATKNVFTDSSKTTISFAKTTVEGTPIAPGETPKLSYTKGDVTAVDGGTLQNILDFLITNNVPPAVIPHLVSATTNTAGTQVILTFDTDIASVTGKQAEFGVKTVVQSISLSGSIPSAPYGYVIAKANNGGMLSLIIPQTSTAKIYIKSDGMITSDTTGSKFYTSSDNGVSWGTAYNSSAGESLFQIGTIPSVYSILGNSTLTVYNSDLVSFYATQSLPIPISSASLDSDYQKWSGYPDSPVKTSDYPYQLIRDGVLYISSVPFYYDVTDVALYATGKIIYKWHNLVSGVWAYQGQTSGAFGTSNLTQSNHNIANSTSGTYFAKTTPPPDPKKVILSLNIAGEYQKWSGYPDSPVKTSDYPYQAILVDPTVKLFVSKNPFYVQSSETQFTFSGDGKQYHLNGAVWEFAINRYNGDIPITASGGNGIIDILEECNNQIYNSSALSTVFFAKTTPETASSIQAGQTVKTSFTKGTVQSVSGGALESYTDQAVTNDVPSPYQKWNSISGENIPDGIESKVTYPYQIVFWNGSNLDTIVTWASDKPLQFNTSDNKLYATESTKIVGHIYLYNSTKQWNITKDPDWSAGFGPSWLTNLTALSNLLQGNYDVKDQNGNVIKAKTTP